MLFLVCCFKLFARREWQGRAATKSFAARCTWWGLLRQTTFCRPNVAGGRGHGAANIRAVEVCTAFLSHCSTIRVSGVFTAVKAEFKYDTSCTLDRSFLCGCTFSMITKSWLHRKQLLFISPRAFQNLVPLANSCTKCSSFC